MWPAPQTQDPDHQPPREEKPPTPPAVELSASEHDKTVEDILRANIEGLDKEMNKAEQ